MVLRVAAVKACVGAKFALAVSENVFFQDYLKQLNPGHRPPYRLERIRILECMIEGDGMDNVRTEAGIGEEFHVRYHRLLDRPPLQATVWLLCC